MLSRIVAMIDPYIDCLLLEKQLCIYGKDLCHDSGRVIVDDDDNNTAIGEKHSIYNSNEDLKNDLEKFLGILTN